MDLETREQRVRALETLLAELVKSMRSSFMYPPGHPSLKKSYDNTYRFFQDFLQSGGEFSITSVKEGIDFEEAPLTRDNEALRKLSQDLNLKNIYRLTFKNAMTVQEFEAFVSLVSMDSKKFRDLGGVSTLLPRYEIKNISAKEMEYDNLVKDGQATERVEPEKEGTIEGQSGTHEEVTKLAQAPVEETEEEDELDKEIEQYLSLLKPELDPERFKKILLSLIRLSENLSKEGKTEYVVKIVVGLTRESMSGARRPEAFSKMCVAAVRKCPIDSIIPQALDGFSSKDEKDRGLYRRLIRIIGEKAIEPALMRLIESSDSLERRNLINLLIGFGEAVRPKLEIYLFDERWYVVRNMAVILGEIKSEKSLNPLSRAVMHKDSRVRREVIKALTRIGGKKVPVFLLQLLPTAPEQFALIIINSLGVLGDASATEPLIAIVRKRDPLHRNYELRKESIAALAKLKNPDAVEALGRILLKKEFLGGMRYEDLRISAARALGRIGGQRSIELLTNGSKLRNRNVKRAAAAALLALGIHQ
jgi:HEAT repeat protein